eukprot:5163636-Amphidinium_carterae.1
MAANLSKPVGLLLASSFRPNRNARVQRCMAVQTLAACRQVRKRPHSVAFSNFARQMTEPIPSQTEAASLVQNEQAGHEGTVGEASSSGDAAAAATDQPGFRGRARWALGWAGDAVGTAFMATVGAAATAGAVVGGATAGAVAGARGRVQADISDPADVALEAPQLAARDAASATDVDMHAVTDMPAQVPLVDLAAGSAMPISQGAASRAAATAPAGDDGGAAPSFAEELLRPQWLPKL